MEHILVGTCVEEEMMLERKVLMEALQGNNINCKSVGCKWPRDSFISHSGKVYKRKNYGFYSDGGYVLNNPEFTFACSEVSFNEDLYIDTPEERYKLLQNLYGKNVFILPPPDKSLNFNLSPHIDLVVLPIPKKNVLFADKIYYHANKKSIDLLCKRYNLNLEMVVNDYSNPSYPCNSLILDNVVVTNATNNEGFISMLKDYSFDVIAVPFSTNCLNGGSVHCATNTIPERYIDRIEELLEVE